MPLHETLYIPLSAIARELVDQLQAGLRARIPLGAVHQLDLEVVGRIPGIEVGHVQGVGFQAHVAPAEGVGRAAEVRRGVQHGHPSSHLRMLLGTDVAVIEGVDGHPRNLDGSEPRYYLSNAPEDTPLETLAYVGGSVPVGV